jgi:hypothetical protein
MTDDIVTRLRKIASYSHDPEDIVPRLRNIDCRGNGLCETAIDIASGDIEMLRNIIAEAVDEIEHLRKTVQDFLMQAGQDAYDIKRLREELVQAKYGIEDMYKND